ncbi:leucine-rich repeat extensin-like protein 4 [Phragmites australis]|uniref:leucine-rich repeat extensin-like protein 4 n=1 Tax=Phragmites australis TaxID=29695 RepID=UPI002D773EE7|nr:leucine-rich repeat extensin-like protein 4 [Phragmites australis]
MRRRPPFHARVAAAAVLLLLLSPAPTSQFGLGAAIGAWINGAPPPSPSTVSSSPSSAAQGQRQEYTALQALKAAITEDPRGALSSWQGANVCTYKGVYCSSPPDGAAAEASTVTVVAGIDLNHANLRGTLPDAVSLLAHLTFLHLNSNRLAGAVPDALRDLLYLTELDLSNNLFSGPFPTSTLLIPSLVYLDLRFNAFSGEVPPEVFTKNLDAVFLNNNQFEGQIPETLWSSAATVITLANNRLTGPVPAAYGYGAVGGRVREVLFLNNNLTGCVPEALGILPSIQVLDLSYNALSGHLPSTLSCLSGIEVLNIAHNQLTGELPDLLCDLRRITNLSVSFNFFSGISQRCDQLAGRSMFDFVGNCVPGRDMQRPQPECDGFSGDGGLSCLRIPGVRPVGCAEAAVSIGVGISVGGLPFGLPGATAGGVVTVTVP